MTIAESFDSLQEEVDADVGIVLTARQRRDDFKAALITASDVSRVWGSGSLARSTQLQPVHDVDLVVEFDEEAHPNWGQPGSSAEEALDRCRDLVNELLSINGGSYMELVRQVNTAKANRAAKCFIDPPDTENAFTVDVMPALRRTDGILIPMKLNRTWSLADPKYMIDEVIIRQSQWAQFRPLVRLLKYWSKRQHGQVGKVKSLVMEVLALECLPAAGTRAEALRTFFQKASVHDLSVSDPAGLSGIVQPSLNISALRTALEDAAADSAAALAAVVDNDSHSASKHWQSVFGSAFPLIAAATGGAATTAARPVRDSPQG